MEELIPTGWQIVSIGKVTLPIEKVDPTQNPDQEIDYLDISGINNKSNIVEEAKRYFGKDAPSRARQLIKREDILFSTVRTYLRNIAMVPVIYDGQVASTGFSILRAAEGINSKFLFYYTLTQGFLNPLTELQRGSSYPAVRDDDVRIQKIPIAPYNEQKRIVAKIEELFSELDKGIENLKTAREQLKVYRQAVLKHAFEGKLTTRWREQNKDKLETSGQLLERIKREREAYYQIQLEEWKESIVTWETNGKEGKQPSQPKSPDKIIHIREEDLKQLPKLPQGWMWIKLLNISKNIQIGPFGSLLHQHDYIAGGWPLVNPSHIKNQQIYPDNNLTITTEKLRELTNYRLQEGDVVMGRRGEMGRCAVVTKKEAGWLCGTGSLFVRLLDSYSPWFYCQALSSQRAKEYLSSSSIGTTMQNLNQKILDEMPVPVCSAEEQIEIMKEIERQFSIIDGLEETINSELHKSEAFRQSILKKAFSGKLVAQDPNDEPASVLLERIRAEKEAQKTESKKPKAKRKAA